MTPTTAPERRERHDDRHIWSKWFWTDWRADAGIEACSWTARGLWMECLALMAKADPRGYLLVGGRTPTDKLLLKLTRGNSMAELKRCLEELTTHHVCSWTTDGVMYSRRMVRDALTSARNRQNGSQGGNPLLVNRPRATRLTDSDNESDNQKDNRPSKPQKLEARSQKPEPEAEHPPNPPRPAGAGLFARFWAAYPRHVSKADAEKAFAKLHADDALVDALLEALAWQCTTPQWTREGGKYIPHPATWLNGRRWEDEPVRDLGQDATDAAWAAVQARLRPEG